jgi:hypothetical protein
MLAGENEGLVREMKLRVEKVGVGRPVSRRMTVLGAGDDWAEGRGSSQRLAIASPVPIFVWKVDQQARQRTFERGHDGEDGGEE